MVEIVTESGINMHALAKEIKAKHNVDFLDYYGHNESIKNRQNEFERWKTVYGLTSLFDTNCTSKVNPVVLVKLKDVAKAEFDKAYGTQAKVVLANFYSFLVEYFNPNKSSFFSINLLSLETITNYLIDKNQDKSLANIATINARASAYDNCMKLLFNIVTAEYIEDPKRICSVYDSESETIKLSTNLTKWF